MNPLIGTLTDRVLWIPSSEHTIRSTALDHLPQLSSNMQENKWTDEVEGGGERAGDAGEEMIV
jgi:hypothetical protein